VSTASFAEQILQLCDLSEVMGGHAAVDDLAHLLSRHLRRLSPASLVVFYLIDQDHDVLRAVHASGPGDAVTAGLELALGDGLSGWVAVNGRSIRNSNPALDFGERTASLPAPLQTTLATPLVCEEGTVGVISLYAPAPDAFSADHQQVLELVARPVAAALRRARQFELERRASLTDAETGLPSTASPTVR
jgi:GAF domain-containing protein